MLSTATGSVQVTKAENFSRSAYVISGLEGHVEPKDGGSTSETENQLLITGKNLKLSHKESFFLSGKGYSTQTSKLIMLSSLLLRLTNGFVIWRNARPNPRNVRVGGYIASYTGHKIENAFHVRLVTCTTDIATTPIA